MPEHPSNAAINTLRNGQGTFLGKGDDGLVYDTHDGNVAKVTTVVPYNLQNFRHHTHAVADARRQAEINNQAYNEGHDVFLPQQFEEHGEKGFTTRPKLEIGGTLSPMQIAEYREKMQRAWEAGWRVNDTVQHGVDAEGRIRVYDTGKMSKISPSQDPQGFDLDDWGQLSHARKLMSEHGHYDEQSDSDDIRDFLNDDSMQQLAWYNSQHKPKDKVNPLETFAPSQWKRFTDAIYGLIQNESEELGFHVDDVRSLLDEIDSQVKATRQTQPAFTAKTNDENADFWITRKGGEKTVGTPHKDFRKESIGIAVDKNQLDPADAFYLFQHVKDNLNFWEPRARGTLNLKNIRLSDVKELAKEVAPADTKPVPKGYESILPLRKALDKYESETANRVLDKRLLNAQAIFDNAVTEYEQYDDDDLPHGESLDAHIYDRDLFSQLVPDLSEQDLATLSLAAYRTGPYHDDDNFLVAGFEIEPSELSYGSDTRDGIVSALTLQADLGLNHKGEKFAIGQKDYEGVSYEPQTIREHEYDAFLRNQYLETDDFGLAGFITADGAMLDLSDGSDSRIVDHRDAAMTDDAARRWGLEPDMGKDYSQYHKLHHILYNANAIRFDANANMLDMPAYPTTAQLQTIADFIKGYAPDYMVLKLGDVEWDADNPTIGLLMRQFESVANGINPDDEGWPGLEYDDEGEDYYAARYGAEDDPINPDNLDDGTPPEKSKKYDNLEISKPKGRKFTEGFGSSQKLGIPNYTQNEALVQPEDFERFDHGAYMQQPISKNDGAKLISDYEYHADESHSYNEQDEESKRHILGRSHIVPDLFRSDKTLQELYERTHRKDNDHPDEENDDYYYHVTKRPIEAISLSTENLSNPDPSGLELIEKKDLRYWMSYYSHAARNNRINNLESRYVNTPLEEGQERLENREAAEHYFNWQQAVKTSPLDFDDDDIQVHRIAKSKIQPYVATEYKHRSDIERQNYPVFTSNTHIKQRVREAREAIGKVQKMGSDDRKELDDLTKEKTRLESSVDLHRNRTLVDSNNEYNNLRIKQNYLEAERQEEVEDLSVKKVGSKTYAEGNHKTVYALYGYYFERDENGLPKRTQYEIIRAPISEAQISNYPDGNGARDILRHRAVVAGIMPWESVPFEQEKLIPDWDYNKEQYVKYREQIEKQIYGEMPSGESGRQMFENLVNGMHRVNRATQFSSYSYDPYHALQVAREMDEEANYFAEAGVISRDEKNAINGLYQQARAFNVALDNEKKWRSQNGDRKTELLGRAARNQLEEMQLKVASNPEYHRWAGENKAVDEEGLPLIIFHGTHWGGFGEMTGSDVEGHVYGSTNVDVASSYTGGRYTDDITPALATNVEDIASSLANSRMYALLQFDSPEKQMTRYAIVKSHGMDELSNPEDFAHRDKLIPMSSEDELIVQWNKWISEAGKEAKIGSHGVYPLIFRLNNPLVVEGGRSNWSGIPVYPHVKELDALDVMQIPFIERKIREQYYGMSDKLANDLEQYVVDRLSEDYEDEELESSQELLEFREALERPTVDFVALSNLIDMAASWSVSASDIIEDIFEIPTEMTTREWAEFAEEEGHDGIIFKDITDMGSSAAKAIASDVFVAFGYGNVKSAHNIGTFEQETPRGSKLLYSAVS